MHGNDKAIVPAESYDNSSIGKKKTRFLIERCFSSQQVSIKAACSKYIAWFSDSFEIK